MVVSGREQIIGMSIRLLIVGVAIIFALFPVLYIILSAFNPAGQLSSGLSLPKVDSFSELFVNFRALMFEESNIWPFWRWLGNSFVVASVSTALTVLISALPYQGTAACDDRTYREASADGAPTADRSPSADGAASADAAEPPWWDFLIFWD